MSDKRYNIHYFHGLDSSLTLHKRQVMEMYGTVHAPDYDYRNPKVLEEIYKSFDPDDNTLLIGSSFGGYMANILSLENDIPCLLFNPALAFRSIPGLTDAPVELENNISGLTYVVLGKKDTVISPELNKAFINKYFKGPKEIVIEPNLKHRVPLPVFKKHVKKFFRQLIQALPPP